MSLPRSHLLGVLLLASSSASAATWKCSEPALGDFALNESAYTKADGTRIAELTYVRAPRRGLPAGRLQSALVVLSAEAVITRVESYYASQLTFLLGQGVDLASRGLERLHREVLGSVGERDSKEKFATFLDAQEAPFWGVWLDRKRSELLVGTTIYPTPISYGESALVAVPCK